MRLLDAIRWWKRKTAVAEDAPVGLNRSSFLRTGAAAVMSSAALGTHAAKAAYLPFTGAVAVPLTALGSNGAGFFTTDTTPGVINKIGDRLMVGAATANTGAAGFTTPYLTPTHVGYFDNATFCCYSADGGVASAFVSKTSLAPSGSLFAPIAVAACNYSDSTTLTAGTWAFYGVGMRMPGTAGTSTLTAELSFSNECPMVANGSYAIAPVGVTSNLWLSCGGERAAFTTVNPVSCAVMITTNDANSNSLAGTGGVFNKGIVFGRTALTGSNSGAGISTAIEMAYGQSLFWKFDNSAAYGAAIISQASAASGQIMFKNASVAIQDTSANTLYAFNTPASCTNGFAFTPSAVSTVGPTITSASSANTNVDLLLFGQGTGGIILEGNTKVTTLSSTAQIEHGSTSIATAPLMDWHSSGINQDYDFRFQASGGTIGAGLGTMTMTGAQLTVVAPTSVTSLVVAGNTSIATISGVPGIEHGSTTVAAASVFDWHSSGVNYDYDFRMQASGGAASAGSGQLTLTGGQLVVNAPTNLSAALTLTSALADSSVVTSTPTAGSTLTLGNSWRTIYLGSSTLSVLTITLPASPILDQIASITVQPAITALTIVANTGQTISGGAVTSAPSAAQARYEYIFLTGSIWTRVA